MKRIVFYTGLAAIMMLPAKGTAEDNQMKTLDASTFFGNEALYRAVVENVADGIAITVKDPWANYFLLPRYTKVPHRAEIVQWESPKDFLELR